MACVLADQQARTLRRARDALVLPLAAVASAFVQQSAWVPLGYMDLCDYTRERLDRSARWMRDFDALAKGMDNAPRLRAALLGRDGGVRLGTIAALCVARFATAGTIEAWIAYARSVSVRELRDAIATARGAGRLWPPGMDAEDFAPGAASSDAAGATRSESSDRAEGSQAQALDDDDPEDGERCLVRIPIPEFLLYVFDEVRDLFGALSGHAVGPTELLEACLGESWSGRPLDAENSQTKSDHSSPLDGRPIVLPLQVGIEDAVRERLYARTTEHWKDLPGIDDFSLVPDPETKHAEEATAIQIACDAILKRLVDLGLRAGEGNPQELDAQLRSLVSLEDEIERLLGRLLALMSRRGAWKMLGFASAAHYSEERLGMRRRTALRRKRLGRVLEQHPILWEAYETGRIGQESVFILQRLFAARQMDQLEESNCIDHAARLTVKRQRQERLWQGRAALDRMAEAAESAGPSAADLSTADSSAADPSAAGPSVTAGPLALLPPVSLDDATWFASLYRRPGTSLERLDRWTRGFVQAHETEPLPGDNVFLELRLRRPLAETVVAAIDEWTQRVTQVAVELEFGDANAAALDSIHTMAAVRMARLYAGRGKRPPQWVGFFAFLEQAVRTWDDPRAHTRHAAERTYRKAGFTCMAPGCTRRCGLEQHHILYGNGQRIHEPWNLICLCRGHHQLGQHAGFAAFSGRAPLEVLCRLGRPEYATWFMNERKIDPPLRDGDRDPVPIAA
jgi:hypothetical protein